MRKFIVGALMWLGLVAGAYGQSISQLPSAASANLSDLIAASQVNPTSPGGTGFSTRKLSLSQIVSLLNSGATLNPLTLGTNGGVGGSIILNGSTSGSGTISINSTGDAITSTDPWIFQGSTAVVPAVGQTIITGIEGAPTLTNNGSGAITLTAGGGLHLQGAGSSNDVVLLNKSGLIGLQIPTGTQNVAVLNQFSASAGIASGINGGTGGSLTLNGSTSGSITESIDATATTVSFNGTIGVTGGTGLFVNSGNIPAITTNGQAGYASSATNGASILGQGSTNDANLRNKNNVIALAVPTGTVNVQVGGGLSSGNAAFGISGSLTLNGSTSGNGGVSVNATGALSLGTTTAQGMFFNDGGNGSMFIAVGAGGAIANQIAIKGSLAAGTPAFTAGGSDTNININLSAKGTGTVQLGNAGSFTANGAGAAVTFGATTPAAITTPATVFKWLTLVDNGGNTFYVPTWH